MEALDNVKKLYEDFQPFDDNSEDGLILQTFMGELPEKYSTDYLVYAASSSLEEEVKVWETDYVKVVKRMLFKKFDNWLEKQYFDREKNG